MLWALWHKYKQNAESAPTVRTRRRFRKGRYHIGRNGAEVSKSGILAFDTSFECSFQELIKKYIFLKTTSVSSTFVAVTYSDFPLIHTFKRFDQTSHNRVATYSLSFIQLLPNSCENLMFFLWFYILPISSKKARTLFCCLMYLQCLEQCLAHWRCSIIFLNG